MRIGVIGSGRIGSTAAGLFAGAGHEVAIANSRGPESLTGLVEELGEGVSAATVEGAAGFGDAVLVAIPFGRYRELPPGPFADTIVVDATNYFPQRDGNLPELDEDAKDRVSALIEEIGFAPIDTGSLAEGGRRQQTGSPVFTRLIAVRDAKEALAAGG